MMSSNEQEIASLLPAFMFDNDDDIYALSITRLRRLGSSLSMLAQDCNLVSKEVDLRIIRLFLISEGLPQADQEIIELLRAILRNDVRPKQTLCKFCEREDSLKKYMASIGINPVKCINHIIAASIAPDLPHPLAPLKVLDKDILSYLSKTEKSNNQKTMIEKRDSRSLIKSNQHVNTRIITQPTVLLNKNKTLTSKIEGNSPQRILRRPLTKLEVTTYPSMVMNESGSIIGHFGPSVIKEKVLVEVNEDDRKLSPLTKAKKRKLSF